MDERVKVHFELVPDEDDWPPSTVESVWAKPGAAKDEYVIENIPFFTPEATIGDTVQVREEDGNLWFEKVVKDSPNSLIRIIVKAPHMFEAYQDRLIAMGCQTEGFPGYKLIAVSIPADVDLVTVQNFLKTQETAGLLGYEEPILKQ